MPSTAGRAWQFGVTVEHSGDTVVLRLAGRFGHRAAAAFDDAVRRCLDGAVHSVAIDLTGVDYLSSPGLRAIVRLADAMQQRRGQVVVRGARDAVRVTLALADFTKSKQHG